MLSSVRFCLAFLLISSALVSGWRKHFDTIDDCTKDECFRFNMADSTKEGFCKNLEANDFMKDHDGYCLCDKNKKNICQVTQPGRGRVVCYEWKQEKLARDKNGLCGCPSDKCLVVEYDQYSFHDDINAVACLHMGDKYVRDDKQDRFCACPKHTCQMGPPTAEGLDCIDLEDNPQYARNHKGMCECSRKGCRISDQLDECVLMSASSKWIKRKDGLCECSRGFCRGSGYVGDAKCFPVNQAFVRASDSDSCVCSQTYCHTGDDGERKYSCVAVAQNKPLQRKSVSNDQCVCPAKGYCRMEGQPGTKCVNMQNTTLIYDNTRYIGTDPVTDICDCPAGSCIDLKSPTKCRVAQGKNGYDNSCLN